MISQGKSNFLPLICAAANHAGCFANAAAFFIGVLKQSKPGGTRWQKVGKPIDQKTLARGLRADSLSTVIGRILNAFPYTAFAQNVGLVGLTGVRSRFVVSSAGVILIVLGLLPKLAAVVASIPQPILGGTGLALFGTVAASGIRTLTKVKFDGNYNVLIVAISVGVGLIPVGAPTFYSKFPAWSQIILNSGITAGGITVILLNVFLNGGGGVSEAEALEESAFATEQTEEISPQVNFDVVE